MTTNYEKIKQSCSITGSIQDLAQELMEIPQSAFYNENTMKEYLQQEVD